MLGLLLGFMPRVKQHERWLLDRIATHILAFEDDGLLARAQTRIFLQNMLPRKSTLAAQAAQVSDTYLNVCEASSTTLGVMSIYCCLPTGLQADLQRDPSVLCAVITVDNEQLHGCAGGLRASACVAVCAAMAKHFRLCACPAAASM